MTAISVAALLVSGTYLGQHVLDSLRLGEADAVKVRLADPPIEARLSEDPFAALARHVAKLKAACDEGKGTAGDRCKDGKWGDTELSELQDTDELTVIAALVPGASFVGVEEARRRARYALLAGLSAEGFVPDDSEHMRLLKVSVCGSFLPCEGQASDGKKLASPPSAAIGTSLQKDQRQEAALSGPGTPGATTNDAAAGQNPAPPALAAPSVGLDKATNVSSANSDIAIREFNVAYETLSAPGEKMPKRAVVLWIDDSKIGKRWLSTLAGLFRDVTGPPSKTVRLRIVGPFTSDKLVDALGYDLARLKVEASPDKEPLPKTFSDRWETLLALRLLSPSSTAPAEQLRSEAARSAKAAVSSHPGMPSLFAADCGKRDKPAVGTKPVDCVDEGFRDQLKAIAKVLKERPAEGPAVPDRFFVRTIGSDEGQIDLLVREMLARGLGEGGRVILVREWDSIYARTFADTLAEKLRKKFESAGTIGADGTKHVAQKVTLEVYSYLRGLDGTTVEGAPKQQRLVSRSAEKDRDDRKPQPEIEWPESRDQRDYVRRLVENIEKGAHRNASRGKTAGKEPPKGTGDGRIMAIGMIGADVHDKLILAQALRGAFPDRMLFTTDLDARFLHPEVLKFTRNLVVASSLPLLPDDRPTIGVAPFRDSYQTATFLAARDAASTTTSAVAAEPVGRLYEIGNDGEVQLGVDGVPEGEKLKRHFWAISALFVLAVLAWSMLVGKPAPAMQAALSGETVADEVPPVFATAFVAGLQVAAWGFALGVVIELGIPGSMGPYGAILLAAALALWFWTLVYPGSGSTQRNRLVLCTVGTTAVLALITLVSGQLAGVFQPEDAGMREPLAPGSGISAWPSQLLRTLIVVLFAWFLDFTLNTSAAAARKFGKDYFAIDLAPLAVVDDVSYGTDGSGSEDAGAVGTSGAKHTLPETWWRQAWRWFLAVRLQLWRPDGDQAKDEKKGEINGADLWRNYLGLLANGPRCLRSLLWFFAIVVVVGVEMLLLSGENPEIPARGLDDRTLFWFTILASVFGTVFLLVLVGDVTVLTWRIVAILKKGRTIYPEGTIRLFWLRLGISTPQGALGPQAASQDPAPVWMPVRARVEDRDKTDPSARNSLLDDWIDAKLLAEHTEKIGPLIFYPFILLALLIVSRSRLLDNWAPAGVVMVVLATYLLWAVAMAAALNIVAEMARREAVDNMRADLRWMEGTGRHEGLTKQFKELIEDVMQLRQGAFAPFFEQPLVRAILVALGGAGGIRLLELVVFGR